MSVKSRTFTYDYDAPLEAVWAAMADTARYNEAADLPKHDVQEEVLDHYGIRFFAKARMGPFSLKWEDLPCNWVRNQWFRHERRFSEGPLASLDAQLKLEPIGSGCRGYYTVEASASGWLGRIILATAFFPGVKKTFTKLSKSAERFARGEQTLAFPIKPPSISSDAKRRLDAAVSAIKETPRHFNLAERLAAFVVEGPQTEVMRIRPLRLAELWGEEERNVVELCLEATRAGVLELRWDILCPRCRVAKSVVHGLDALPDGAHCGTCNIDYGREFAKNVELSFKPAPTIREVEIGEFCLLGPMSTPHIVAHVTLEAGETKELGWHVKPGDYRLRTLEAGPDFDLTYQEGGFPAVMVDENRIFGEPQEEPSRLRLVNRSPWRRTLVVEDRAWAKDALTADRVTAIQSFRDLFSDQVLRPGDEVGISRITLMFSDLEGSTALYGQIGDANAYHLVRDHFAFMQSIVREEGGTIVKTIGDAVMAAFYQPEAAVRSAIIMQQRIAEAEEDARLRLKLGLHAGPCITVTLNDQLDYFGSTVNMAARLQALSEGDDIVISSELASDPEVVPILQEYNPETERAELKGFDDLVEFARLRFDAHSSN